MLSMTPRPRFSQRPLQRSQTQSFIDASQETEQLAFSDQDHDLLSEVIMSVDANSRGEIGCAYYIASEQRLFVMEDIASGGPELIEALKLYIGPTAVLAPFKLHECYLNILDPTGRTRGQTPEGDEDFGSLPYNLDLRPGQEFGFEEASNELVKLARVLDCGDFHFSVPSDAWDDDDDASGNFSSWQSSTLRLTCWINMDGRLTVGCAGAILAALRRRRSIGTGSDDALHAMLSITSIEVFTLKGSMFVNLDTLLSLQVMQSKSHAHLHNQGPTKKSSGAKEGLSLFGLFQPLARTPQGKNLLRQYFLRPSTDMEVIRDRHAAIAVFVHPDNTETIDEIMGHLQSVGNMRRVLVSLRKGINGASSGRGAAFGRTIWSSLRNFAFHALAIRDALQQVVAAETLTIFGQIMEQFEAQTIASVGRDVNAIIDFEQSDILGRSVVRAGLDEGLDNLKRTYDGLEDLLSEVADHIASDMPAHLDARLNVMFFPQIGFLIAVRLDSRTGTGVFEGSEHDPWEKMFAAEAFAYYKNRNVREMDGHLGDIYGRICDAEIEITYGLAERVLVHENLLSSASDLCGLLDSLIALAQGAKQYRLVRPSMTAENVLIIKGGRHLLQELTVPSFVTNDMQIFGGASADSDDFSVGADGEPNDRDPMELESDMFGTRHKRLQAGPSVIIVTGPNYSGKSVLLKQTALIAFMAHVGCFVPAEDATIGITDKILTRVTTRESVTNGQSTFMIDLQQACVALNLATPRSLLILDEFGKGTDSSDGIGLAAGVVQHLLGLGADCPRVLLAAHFHELGERHGFLDLDNPLLAFGMMEIRLRSNSTIDDEAGSKVTYLYNYRPGRSKSSYGTCCARMNGISDATVDRAEEILELLAKGEDLIAACATMPQHEMARLRQSEQVARTFLEVDLNESSPREMLGRLLSDVGAPRD